MKIFENIRLINKPIPSKRINVGGREFDLLPTLFGAYELNLVGSFASSSEVNAFIKKITGHYSSGRVMIKGINVPCSYPSRVVGHQIQILCYPKEVIKS